MQFLEQLWKVPGGIFQKTSAERQFDKAQSKKVELYGQ